MTIRVDHGSLQIYALVTHTSDRPSKLAVVAAAIHGSFRVMQHPGVREQPLWFHLLFQESGLPACEGLATDAQAVFPPPDFEEIPGKEDDTDKTRHFGSVSL